MYVSNVCIIYYTCVDVCIIIIIVIVSIVITMIITIIILSTLISKIYSAIMATFFLGLHLTLFSYHLIKSVCTHNYCCDVFGWI